MTFGFASPMFGTLQSLVDVCQTSITLAMYTYSEKSFKWTRKMPMIKEEGREESCKYLVFVYVCVLRKMK
jgi:hypothetical protein